MVKGRTTLGLLILATTGCGPTITTAVEWRHQMSARTAEPVTKEGLVVEAKVLGLDEEQKDPRLMKSVKFKWGEFSVWKGATTGDGTQAYEQDAPWLLLSPPIFQLKITNNTSHVVRMKGAVVKLIDAAGNTYEPTDKDVVVAGLAAELANSEPQFRDALAKQGKTFLGFESNAVAKLQGAIATLKLLNQNAELLPNFTETYIVAFQLPIEPGSMKAYQDWVQAQSALTLKIFDITAETDQAGNPTKKVTFEFPIVVRSFKDTVQVTDGARHVMKTDRRLQGRRSPRCAGRGPRPSSEGRANVELN